MNPKIKQVSRNPDKNGRVSGSSDSMEAAAARLGCTITELRRARAAGCDGFEHGRVYLEKVKAWLEANPATAEDMDEEALKKRKLLAQCRKLELDEAILRGEYTDNATVTQVAVAWAAQVRSEFMLLIAEMPTLAGLDAATLQDRAKTFVHNALSRLTAFSAPCTPAK